MIIADWEMPGMTGVELLKKCRGSDENYNDIPFLMVTAMSQKEDVLEAVTSGVSNYIVKPFTTDEIIKKINKMFY